MEQNQKGRESGNGSGNREQRTYDNRVVSMIEKFKASGKYELMKEGERYYQADNDIKNRKITRKVDGHKEEETWRRTINSPMRNIKFR